MERERDRKRQGRETREELEREREGETRGEMERSRALTRQDLSDPNKNAQNCWWNFNNRINPMSSC